MKKNIFIDNIQMETQTVFHADGNINIIPCSFERGHCITPDGDVVRAFEKYGFIWCINWNSGYKDYMHFSFFGT